MFSTKTKKALCLSLLVSLSAQHISAGDNVFDRLKSFVTPMNACIGINLAWFTGAALHNYMTAVHSLSSCTDLLRRPHAYEATDEFFEAYATCAEKAKKSPYLPPSPEAINPILPIWLLSGSKKKDPTHYEHLYLQGISALLYPVVNFKGQVVGDPLGELYERSDWTIGPDGGQIIAAPKSVDVINSRLLQKIMANPVLKEDLRKTLANSRRRYDDPISLKQMHNMIKWYLNEFQSDEISAFKILKGDLEDAQAQAKKEALHDISMIQTMSYLSRAEQAQRKNVRVQQHNERIAAMRAESSITNLFENLFTNGCVYPYGWHDSKEHCKNAQMYVDIYREAIDPEMNELFTDYSISQYPYARVEEA